MPELKFGGIREDVAQRMEPFITDVLEGSADNIHSVHLTGSALTDDFVTAESDINSVFVLKEMDQSFLEILAPKGKKLRKQRIAAPLIMTPAYIRSSCDVFPIIFLNMKLMHKTVYGEDILAGINIDKGDLRHQCERELKMKLIDLRQGYLATMGDAKAIAEGLINSIKGYIPLFRGIVKLYGTTPPVSQAEVITALAKAADIDCSGFESALREKRAKSKLSINELNSMFKSCYTATEKLGKKVDEITI